MLWAVQRGTTNKTKTRFKSLQLVLGGEGHVINVGNLITGGRAIAAMASFQILSKPSTARKSKLKTWILWLGMIRPMIARQTIHPPKQLYRLMWPEALSISLPFWTTLKRWLMAVQNSWWLVWLSLNYFKTLTKMASFWILSWALLVIQCTRTLNPDYTLVPCGKFLGFVV